MSPPSCNCEAHVDVWNRAGYSPDYAPRGFWCSCYEASPPYEPISERERIAAQLAEEDLASELKASKTKVYKLEEQLKECACDRKAQEKMEHYKKLYQGVVEELSDISNLNRLILGWP